MKSKIVMILFVILLTACNSGHASTIAPLPSLTSSAVSTQDAIRIDLINKHPGLEQYNTFCTVTYCSGLDVSPDGKWIYLTNFNTIEVFQVDGEKLGKYSFYDIYGYSIDYYEGYLNGVDWTQDGKYLYLTTHVGGDGGPEAYLEYQSALIRLSLADGTWKDMKISGSFKISPNDELIIFSNDRSAVRIRDGSSGQEEIYPTPDDFHYFGKYVWSHDNKKVIFVGTSESWEGQDSKFALFMIDLERDKTILLYEDVMPFYYPVEWVEGNEVTLNKYQKDGTWTLDLSRKFSDNPSIGEDLCRLCGSKTIKLIYVMFHNLANLTKP